MDTPIPLKDTLSKIYNAKGYFDLYGGSFVLTFVILFIFFIIFSYFYVMNQLKPIKNDWIRQRCSPMVIPFAGLINKPTDKTNAQFTKENFNYCVNNIFEKISSNFFRPIVFLMGLIYQSIQLVSRSIQGIRMKISDITDNLVNINQRIIGRVFSFIIPLQYMFIKLRDLLQKTNGIIVAKIFSLLTGYYSIYLFIRIFFQMMIAGLVALAAIIAKLLASLFLAPVAAPLLAIFLTVTGLMVPILVGLGRLVGKTRRSLPRRPKCFDEDTILVMNDGREKKIKDVRIGDVLIDGSVVHSFFKVLRSHTMDGEREVTDMYHYKDILVSGNHSIYIDGKWNHVKDLKDAILVPNYAKKYLYCLNTTSKRIWIKGYEFADWDDLEDKEIERLERKLNRMRENEDIKHIILRKYSIMNHLEGGFVPETPIELYDGSISSLKNISIGDRLKGDIRVIGIVEVMNNLLYKMTLPNGRVVYGKSHNIFFLNKERTTSTLQWKREIWDKKMKLYHLLTDRGYFYLEDYRFTDYDGNIETLL